MIYFEKSIEYFLEKLAFDSDFYDVYSHSQLLEYAQDFIQSYEINIVEGDYRNDQNKEGHYYCDLASEWADSQVDIYNSDLWEKAPKFQWWIEEAINDFWFDKSRGMTGLLQIGQYLYYSALAWDILNSLADYVKA